MTLEPIIEAAISYHRKHAELALRNRIADELDRMSDDYIELPSGSSTWDVWEFSAYLAKKIRSGEIGQHPNQELPF